MIFEVDPEGRVVLSEVRIGILVELDTGSVFEIVEVDGELKVSCFGRLMWSSCRDVDVVRNMQATAAKREGYWREAFLRRDREVRGLRAQLAKYGPTSREVL